MTNWSFKRNFYISFNSNWYVSKNIVSFIQYTKTSNLLIFTIELISNVAFVQYFLCWIIWELINLTQGVGFLNQFVIIRMFSLNNVKSRILIWLLFSRSKVNCNFVMYELKISTTKSTCSFLTTTRVLSTYLKYTSGTSEHLNNQPPDHPLQCRQRERNSVNP